MHQSKLIKLLALLKPQEVHRVVRFMQTPFLSYRKEAKLLFDYIIKYAPDYKQEGLSRKVVANALFSHRKDCLSALNHAASELFKLLEQIIAHLMFENDAMAVKINLLRFYESRTDGILLENAVESVRRQNDKSILRDEYYYYNDYLLNDLFAFVFADNQKRIQEIAQKGDQSLDIFYAICKLQYLLTLLTYYRLENKPIEMEKIENVLFYITSNKALFSNTTIKLYYHGVMLHLERDSDEHYRTLKELLNKHFNVVNILEIRALYIIAEAYCIAQIKKGRQEFFAEMLSLYESRLNNKLLHLKGRLPDKTFRNMLVLYIKINDLRAAEKFVRDYGPALHPANRQSSIAYVNGLIAFVNEDYPTAISYLLSVEKYPSSNLKFEARIVLIKSYYELRYFDLNRGDEILESTTIALHQLATESETMPNSVRVKYKNFTIIMKRILRIAVTRNHQIITPQRIASIRQDINERQIFEKEWLLEKLDQLDKKIT